jgi:D-alanyl-D-alanine carboxypeptidase
MRNRFQKIIFLAAVFGAVIFSGVIHPSWFIPGEASSADVSNGTGSATGSKNHVPLLVLPSLSANIGTQAATKPEVGAVSVGNAATDTSFGAPVGSAPLPNVGASAVLIADLESGATLAGVNASGRWPMASISKLMTAAVATDVLGPDQRITITDQMLAVDPTQQILHLGDTYTVSDLLHIMLLPSNNVAAEALADFYGHARFIAAMNAKAAAWGMAGTYYDDPSGLSAANESSANDLLKLAQHLFTAYPQVLAVTRLPQTTAQNLSTGAAVAVKSINSFAGQADFIGGKTGYTDQADGNLLSIFNDAGRPVFIIVLGINDSVRFDATQRLYTWLITNFK